MSFIALVFRWFLFIWKFHMVVIIIIFWLLFIRIRLSTVSILFMIIFRMIRFFMIIVVIVFFFWWLYFIRFCIIALNFFITWWFCIFLRIKWIWITIVIITKTRFFFSIKVVFLWRVWKRIFTIHLFHTLSILTQRIMILLHINGNWWLNICPIWDRVIVTTIRVVFLLIVHSKTSLEPYWSNVRIWRFIAVRISIIVVWKWWHLGFRFLVVVSSTIEVKVICDWSVFL